MRLTKRLSRLATAGVAVLAFAAPSAASADWLENQSPISEDQHISFSGYIAQPFGSFGEVACHFEGQATLIAGTDEADVAQLSGDLGTCDASWGIFNGCEVVDVETTTTIEGPDALKAYGSGSYESGQIQLSPLFVSWTLAQDSNSSYTCNTTSVSTSGSPSIPVDDPQGITKWSGTAGPMTVKRNGSTLKTGTIFNFELSEPGVFGIITS